MTVDYDIECDGERGMSARLLAGIMVAIFPVGVPLLLFFFLFANRREIMQRQTRSGAQELGYIGNTRLRG